MRRPIRPHHAQRRRPLRSRGRFRRGRVGQTTTQRAQARLKAFRGASLVAVSITGLLLFAFSPSEVGLGQQGGAPADSAAVADSASVADSLPTLPDTVAIIREVPLAELQTVADSAAAGADTTAEAAAREATTTLEGLWRGFVRNLPKYGIVLGILLAAAVLGRLLRPVLRLVLRGWERAEAFSALANVIIWLLAFGIALSVLVGDIRALVGSLGLVGLALSWALQTPIESFTGWVLNSLRGYYRVGDRVAVAERGVFGDVFRIDLLTTTVWEFGGPERPGLPVRGEQATGRMVTFPNSELLTGTIINYTRDFPFVWDEIAIEFSPSETDIPYLVAVSKRVTDEVVGDYMAGPAKQYSGVLRHRDLEPWVSEEPQVFVALSDDQWLELTVRYLVGARERRAWKSRLTERLLMEYQKPEHQGRIVNAFPRRLVQFLDAEGRVITPGEGGDAMPA